MKKFILYLIFLSAHAFCACDVCKDSQLPLEETLSDTSEEIQRINFQRFRDQLHDALKAFPSRSTGHLYCKIGFYYKYGLGCEKDEVKAVKYFRNAVDQGEWFAYFNLAALYEKGRGGLHPEEERAALLFMEGLKKCPWLGYFFQGLAKLEKGEPAFLLWLGDIEHSSPPVLTKERVRSHFERFRSILAQGDLAEKKLLQAIGAMGSNFYSTLNVNFMSLLKTMVFLVKKLPHQ